MSLLFPVDPHLPLPCFDVLRGIFTAGHIYRFMCLSPLEGLLLEGRDFVCVVGGCGPLSLEWYLYTVGTQEIFVG